MTGLILRWTPSHTATGPWPPPAPYYPPEWRSQLEEGARREQEKVDIDEVEATNMNGQLKTRHTSEAGLHKLCYPTIRDRSTWSKFGARGEYGDVFLFSNLGAL